MLEGRLETRRDAMQVRLDAITDAPRSTAKSWRTGSHHATWVASIMLGDITRGQDPGAPWST